MASPYIQPTFAGGELSDSLHARVDIEKFSTGLALARNYYIMRHGGATNRPGTVFYAPVQDHRYRHRLIEFEFNTEQTYIIILGNFTAWFMKREGVILNSPVAITNITSANPGVVTAGSHGYATGDTVFIEDVVGMTEVNGQFFEIEVVDGDSFRLQDPDKWTLDTSGYTAYTSGGTVSSVVEIATPWPYTALPELKFEQSADVITFVHPDYAPQELSRTSDTTWTLATPTFGSTVATPTGLAASVGGGTQSYTVTAVDSDGVESLPATPVTNKAAASNTLTWTQVAEADHYRVYQDGNQSGQFGFIGTAEQAASPTFTTPSGSGIDPDYTDGPPSEDTPFDSTDNYPSTTTYYQERRLYGATNNKPTTFFGSVTGDFNNFNKSTPVKDSDAFTFTLASRKVNEIRHFVPLDELIILTSGAEWMVRGQGDGNIISPTQPPNAKPQSYNGSSHLRPLLINNTALYVQSVGAIVRDLGYQLDVDGYQGDDLTVLSDHFFRGYTLDEWAYAKVPDSLVWVVRDDGVMLSLTYLREHKVFAWCQHYTEGPTEADPDLFESVASIPEGNEDAVYVIAKRTVNGNTRRYIERMATKNYGEVRNAIFLDCAVTQENVIDIIDITTDTCSTVTTASAHGLSTGDVVTIEEVVGVLDGAGDSGVNGKTFRVGATTSTTFELDTFETEYTAESLGPELFTNGDFATLDITGWSEASTGTPDNDASSGECVTTSDPGDGFFTQLYQLFSYESGATYRYSVDVTAIQGTDAFIGFGDLATGGINAPVTTTGTYSGTFTYGATHSYAGGVQGPSGYTGGVNNYITHDNWSLKKVLSGGTSDFICFDTTPYSSYISDGVVRLHVSTVSNLHHLERRTVGLLGDGNVLSPQTVVNGQVTLSNPSAVVHVGIPITADLQTLPLEVQTRQEVTAFGAKRTVVGLTLVFKESRGGWVGPDVYTLVPLNQRGSEPWGDSVTAVTGEHRMVVPTDWDRGQLWFRQVDPLPSTILAVIPEVEVGGR